MSSTSRKTSFSSSLIVERWRAEHQLQFPSPCRCTLHIYHVQVSQIWQTRGGLKTVTKANNRKHKTRTAKTLGVEPSSVGKTKPKRTRRLPPTTAVRVTEQASLHYSVVRCSDSHTAHLSSIRKNRKSCSNSFSGLIFKFFEHRDRL